VGSETEQSAEGAGARYAAVALFTFNVLLAVAGFELFSRVITAWTEREQLDDFVESAANLPYYAKQPWSETYWRESAAVARDYRPYVAWREAPFAGETLTIDDAGIRRTPGGACGPGAYRIFAFGGSTMWGVGSPDWGTIPAYLQQLIAQRSATPICVTNLASIGWVSTQSVVALLLELQAGRKPDLAIFYDGVNDVYAAYQNGRAGDHQNLESIRARIDADRHSPLRELWQGSALAALARSAAPPKLQSYRTLGVGAEPLAREVLSVYQANVALVAGLARDEGFRVAFFWQPFLTEGAKRLKPSEQRFRDSLDPDLVELYRLAYDLARTRSADGDFADLAGVFDRIQRPLWIDALGHVSPPGNELVARVIVEQLAAAEAAEGDAPAKRLFAR
jgi:hypothetical protein